MAGDTQSLKNSPSCQSLYFGLAVVLLTGFILGCGKTFTSDADSAKGTVKMKIIAPGSVGADASAVLPYSTAVVDLLGIFDLVSTTGEYAQFYTKASRNNNEIIGSQPQGRFLKNKQGVYIPKNYLSMQIATLYYHTQNLVKLEQSLKFDGSRTTPLKIVLDTPVLNTKQSENNAFYEGSLDAIIFLKYSDGELPLSLNGGVFAHEYFHSIFEKLVLKKLKTNDLFNIPVSINKIQERTTMADVEKIDLSPRIVSLSKKLAAGTLNLSKDNVKWYYALLLKGFNEGLADFWGWSYVNDISFISHSLPQTKTTRKIDLTAQKISSLKLLSDAEMLSIVFQTSEGTLTTQDEKLELINAFSYMLGSRVALFFKSYSETIQKERGLTPEVTKTTMNQFVVDFIQSMAKTLPEIALAADNSVLVTSYSLIYKFLSGQTIPNKNECDLLKTFLENDSKLANTLDCMSSAAAFKLGPKGSQ